MASIHSARQLRHPILVGQVEMALRRAELPPSLLELEITETALIDDMEASTRTLKALKRLGVSLSVDDFGTGYSALAYLQRFPLDTLKLDRQFIQQETNGGRHCQFIRALIELAHSLNLGVVAEGIETADSLQFLQSSGCYDGQGFLLAKPLPAREFREYVAESAERHIAAYGAKRA